MLTSDACVASHFPTSLSPNHRKCIGPCPGGKIEWLECQLLRYVSGHVPYKLETPADTVSVHQTDEAVALAKELSLRGAKRLT
jgi:hypothetical protein